MEQKLFVVSLTIAAWRKDGTACISCGEEQMSNPGVAVHNDSGKQSLAALFLLATAESPALSACLTPPMVCSPQVSAWWWWYKSQ